MLTDHRLWVFPLTPFESAFSITYQERKIEHVLNGLAKVLGVDNKSENVDLFAMPCQDIFQLQSYMSNTS